ncbi:sugar phosphate isomerase/epimerase [Opitutia bacterium ISCC 52]|nr:sugar phosphate isomerase/epimerase [Opitutae bacterium ISCC 52]
MNLGKRGLMRFIRKHRNRVISETSMIRSMAELGFRHIDIQPNMQHSEEAQSILKHHQLKLACMSLSFFGPKDCTLHSNEPKAVEALLSYFKKGIDHSAQVGIDRAYVVPGKAKIKMPIKEIALHYAELATYGAEKNVKIGIEHFPDTDFPSIEATLDFIREVDHPNLYLLFDLGHAQISKEDPTQWLPEAGDRLLYVHLDDNDGIGDLHLPLTKGIQTRAELEDLFSVLNTMNYSGPVSLELHPMLPNPFHALRQSKHLLESIQAFE